ncbi:uncharacterized protein PV06_11030 [Exophiala oligosperma]|uniref:NADH:flavin oxidoreductase/NADH oxidase N-terminal domain-containing protein n=1 Tax=Exophiala oligosperma TaxID=215243 RepID=A0A0D2DLY0_9EURO|nr:uncharacterized protein PV06_11030 [Exophiala oligosperma]KIW36734.1 hypothetical protein PV06_11030 [Exophiala oligosperma]
MSRRFESSSQDASALGEPLTFVFSGRTAPNRFLKGAMTERLSSWDASAKEQRGIPSENLINVYKRWGEGGIGHILTGNIMLDYDQLEAPGNAIIPPGATFHGERFDAFKELARQAKSHGSLITGQVSHPGRQVADTINGNPVSASAVQLEGDLWGMTFAKPHAASQEEIKDIVARFTHAADYLHHAGFDGMQLHGAHGYLLAQFLSKTTNKRSDQYGGSIENRARIILEIAASIRRKVPSDFILGIKMNSVEFQEGGFSAEEAKDVCKLLEDAKFDFVELSGGTYQALAFVHKRESSKKREAFFLEFADKITPGLQKTKTYVTGGFKTVGAMVDALKTVDGVGLGRPVCQEFHLAKDMLDGRVSGAIDQQIDQDDFGLTNIVAGSQIRQVGKDHEPIDMSKTENVDVFMKDMGSWTAKLSSGDPGVYGYIDLDSAGIRPFSY